MDYLGLLVIIPKDQRAGADYVRLMLDGPLWEFYLRMTEIKGTILLMEDGTSIYQSAAAKRWREEKGVKSLLWSALSPDFNPIEQTWKRLKSIIQSRDTLPRNEKDLIEAIQEYWN